MGTHGVYLARTVGGSHVDLHILLPFWRAEADATSLWGEQDLSTLVNIPVTGHIFFPRSHSLIGRMVGRDIGVKRPHAPENCMLLVLARLLDLV